MAEKRKGFVGRLVPWVVVFAVGVGTGYYVRDQRQDERIQEALQRAGQDMLERSREAGGAAVDTAKAALRRLAGDSTGL